MKKSRFSFILCVHGIIIKLYSDEFIKKLVFTVFNILTHNAMFSAVYLKFSSGSYGGGLYVPCQQEVNFMHSLDK